MTNEYVMPTFAHRRLLLVGIFLGIFFAALDQTVVGTAMPRIIGELGGLSIMAWVTTAYMLSSTSVVPIAGKLADLFGRRVIYVTGIVVFMIGSALCGTSTNMTELIIYRGLQGLGGGIMMPMAMVIIGDIFSPEKRGKWQGVIGATFGLSSVVGPTIGGWIVDNTSWHWVFLVNLPVGLLAAVTIYFGLRGEKRVKEQVIIDYTGAVTLVIGIVSLLLGLNLGGKDYPWASWEIIGLFSTAFVFLVVFTLVESRAKEPILSLSLFKNRVFAITNIVGFLMGLGMFGAIMFIPLFLQGVVGISATRSGNTLIPMMLGMVFTSIIAGQIIALVRFRTLFMTGLTLMAVAFYLLSTLAVNTTQLTAISYIVVLGVGMGFIMPTVTIAVQNAFPPEQRGVATSSTQFFRSIGGTLGMTIFGVLLNQRSIELLNKDFFPVVQNIQGLAAGPLGAMLAQARTNPQSLFNILLSPATLNTIPAPSREIILPPLKTALADSLHLVFIVAMGIAVAGVVISPLIGKARIERKSGLTSVEEEPEIPMPGYDRDLDKGDLNPVFRGAVPGMAMLAASLISGSISGGGTSANFEATVDYNDGLPTGRLSGMLDTIYLGSQASFAYSASSVSSVVTINSGGINNLNVVYHDAVLEFDDRTHSNCSAVLSGTRLSDGRWAGTLAVITPEDGPNVSVTGVWDGKLTVE